MTLSIVKCSNTGANPKMSEWAAMAGFANVPEVKVSDPDDMTRGIDSPNPTTGIAWHRDQSGNVFLSANFDAANPTGDSERWMITNLAATSFAGDVSYLGNTTYTQPVGANYNPTGVYNIPAWGYPSTNATTYDNNNRLGLLYTWDAATAGKGGANGQGNPSDEGGSNTFARVQGICPNGWYLPSDYEWTTLENKIITNTSNYSSTPNIGAANILPYTGSPEGFRGTLQGKAMKEECELYTSGALGTSNPVSTGLRGGFNVLLPGYVNTSTVAYLSHILATLTSGRPAATMAP